MIFDNLFGKKPTPPPPPPPPKPVPKLTFIPWAIQYLEQDTDRNTMITVDYALTFINAWIKYSS